MSDRALTCFDYVNQPYPRVREILLANPLDVLRQATAATLHVRIAGFEIGKDVAIEVLDVKHDTAYDRPRTSIALEWQAARHPGMFPVMKAMLFIFPLSPTETQLELRGAYEPPMGKLGDAIDAAAGHRIAVESVSSLIKELAGWLRDALAVVPPSVHPAPDV